MSDQVSGKDTSSLQDVTYVLTKFTYIEELPNFDFSTSESESIFVRNCIQDYVHQVTRGDRLSCYLPPPLQQPSLLGHVFTKVFAEDCQGLFSGEDQPEYRASQVRQLTYQYTCPASVLHAASLAGLPGGPVSSVSSLVIHLVGARSVEVEQAPAWTFTPHTEQDMSESLLSSQSRYSSHCCVSNNAARPHTSSALFRFFYSPLH